MKSLTFTTDTDINTSATIYLHPTSYEVFGDFTFDDEEYHAAMLISREDISEYAITTIDGQPVEVDEDTAYEIWNVLSQSPYQEVEW